MQHAERTIFLVSPFVPYPPARGIELRIFRLLKWMHSAGYNVVLIIPADMVDEEALLNLLPITSEIFWTRPAFRTRVGMRLPLLRKILWEPLKRLFGLLRGENAQNTHTVEGAVRDTPKYERGLGDVHPSGDSAIKGWFAPDKLITLVGKLARRYKPQAVIVEYIFSTPVFAAIPDSTLKIVDTIDVFSRKEEQVLSFGIADPLTSNEEEERRHLLTADVIIAIQSRELNLLETLVPERDVILTGMDLDVVDKINTDNVVADSIAVVASDNALNVHGLKAFLMDCWPIIKSANPSATLHVVGRVGDKSNFDDPAIRYSGWVHDLDRVYGEASVVINPTIAGTGLKIKSVEALAHGKPLVAWTNGVEGLPYTGAAPYAECTSWEQFANSVIRLLRSDSERLKLGERAAAYARREFSADKVYGALGECLNGTKSVRSHSIRVGRADPSLVTVTN